MDKYRIVSDGSGIRFRVQKRFLWRWWTCVGYNEGGGSRALEWGTKQDAREWIRRQTTVAKWEPI